MKHDFSAVFAVKGGVELIEPARHVLLGDGQREADHVAGRVARVRAVQKVDYGDMIRRIEGVNGEVTSMVRVTS